LRVVINGVGFSLWRLSSILVAVPNLVMNFFSRMPSDQLLDAFPGLRAALLSQAYSSSLAVAPFPEGATSEWC
jgi:hypothetical protein